eukprot:gene8522-17578_t
MKGSIFSLKNKAVQTEIDDINSACLIEAADMLCKTQILNMSPLEIIKSSEVDSLSFSIKGGMSSKSYLQKVSNPSVLLAAIINVLEDSKKLFSVAQISALAAGHSNLQAITDSLPGYHKRLLGAIFALLEILGSLNMPNIYQICTSFSNILFDDIHSAPTQSSPSKLFINIAVQSHIIFPYHNTFYHRLNKDPIHDSQAIWNRILQRNNNKHNNDVMNSNAFSSTESTLFLDLDRLTNLEDSLDESLDSFSIPLSRNSNTKPRRKQLNKLDDNDNKNTFESSLELDTPKSRRANRPYETAFEHSNLASTSNTATSNTSTPENLMSSPKNQSGLPLKKPLVDSASSTTTTTATVGKRFSRNESKCQQSPQSDGGYNLELSTLHLPSDLNNDDILSPLSPSDNAPFSPVVGGRKEGNKRLARNIIVKSTTTTTTTNGIATREPTSTSNSYSPTPSSFNNILSSRKLRSYSPDMLQDPSSSIQSLCEDDNFAVMTISSPFTKDKTVKGGRRAGGKSTVTKSIEESWLDDSLDSSASFHIAMDITHNNHGNNGSGSGNGNSDGIKRERRTSFDLSDEKDEKKDKENRDHKNSYRNEEKNISTNDYDIFDSFSTDNDNNDSGNKLYGVNKYKDLKKKSHDEEKRSDTKGREFNIIRHTTSRENLEAKTTDVEVEGEDDLVRASIEVLQHSTDFDSDDDDDNNKDNSDGNLHKNKNKISKKEMKNDFNNNSILKNKNSIDILVNNNNGKNINNNNNSNSNNKSDRNSNVKKSSIHNSNNNDKDNDDSFIEIEDLTTLNVESLPSQQFNSIPKDTVVTASLQVNIDDEEAKEEEVVHEEDSHLDSSSDSLLFEYGLNYKGPEGDATTATTFATALEESFDSDSGISDIKSTRREDSDTVLMATVTVSSSNIDMEGEDDGDSDEESSHHDDILPARNQRMTRKVVTSDDVIHRQNSSTRRQNIVVEVEGNSIAEPDIPPSNTRNTTTRNINTAVLGQEVWKDSDDSDEENEEPAATMTSKSPSVTSTSTSTPDNIASTKSRRNISLSDVKSYPTSTTTTTTTNSSTTTNDNNSTVTDTVPSETMESKTDSSDDTSNNNDYHNNLPVLSSFRKKSKPVTSSNANKETSSPTGMDIRTDSTSTVLNNAPIGNITTTTTNNNNINEKENKEEDQAVVVVPTRRPSNTTATGFFSGLIRRISEKEIPPSLPQSQPIPILTIQAVPLDPTVSNTDVSEQGKSAANTSSKLNEKHIDNGNDNNNNNVNTSTVKKEKSSWSMSSIFSNKKNNKNKNKDNDKRENSSAITNRDTRENIPNKTNIQHQTSSIKSMKKSTADDEFYFSLDGAIIDSKSNEDYVEDDVDVEEDEIGGEYQSEDDDDSSPFSRLKLSEDNQLQHQSQSQHSRNEIKLLGRSLSSPCVPVSVSASVSVPGPDPVSQRSDMMMVNKKGKTTMKTHSNSNIQCGRSSSSSGTTTMFKASSSLTAAATSGAPRDIRDNITRSNETKVHPHDYDKDQEYNHNQSHTQSQRVKGHSPATIALLERLKNKSKERNQMSKIVNITPKKEEKDPFVENVKNYNWDFFYNFGDNLNNDLGNRVNNEILPLPLPPTPMTTLPQNVTDNDYQDYSYRNTIKSKEENDHEDEEDAAGDMNQQTMTNDNEEQELHENITIEENEGNALITISTGRRQLSDFFHPSQYFRPPVLSEFHQALGLDFYGHLEKQGHTGWNK